jgi:spore coat polysaccharide biosynthesis protein SpsF (cytidylyltransferase family)
MSRTVAVVQARMTSTRLPGKVLEPLAGLPVLAWVARAAAAIPGVDEAVVATQNRSELQEIVSAADTSRHIEHPFDFAVEDAGPVDPSRWPTAVWT